FPQTRIGRGDHRALEHAVDACEDILDLGGTDVLAAADDHVALAVGDREVAVAVEHADVPGAVPAAVVECGFGECGVGVARAAIGPAALDLTVVGQPDLAAEQRVSVGAGALLERVVVYAPGDRRMLGRAVHAHDGDAHLRGAICDGRG